MNFEINDYISLGALLVSLLAILYTHLTNTKKYELQSGYRKELLDWYEETLRIMMQLKIEEQNGCLTEEKRAALLAELATCIEVGRFFFPNLDKKDGHGKNKPAAYRGYRNIILDFLVFYHRLFRQEDRAQHLDRAQYLQREFTSQLFIILDPKNYLKSTRKVTRKKFYQELRFEDFMKRDSSDYATFFDDLQR